MFTLYKNNKSVNNINGVELKKIMKVCSIILTLNIQKQLSFKTPFMKGCAGSPGSTVIKLRRSKFKHLKFTVVRIPLI